MRVVTRALVLLAGLAGCAPLDAYIQSLPEQLAVEPDWRPSTEVVRGEGFTRRDIAFACGDTTCAAWLYLPDGVDKPPVIVMANGFCGERDMLMPAYAERFARAGFATLAFDYRYWGDSGGLPRYDVVAEDQVDDYLSAIAWVRSAGEVDGSRVAVWGTSFSGAHAVTVASRDHRVRAVISQVPGLAPPKHHHRLYAGGALWKLVRLAFMDKKRLKKGEERIYIKAYGEEGEFSFMPGAAGFVTQGVPEESDWPNLVTPGMLLDADEYHPLRYARDVESPTLFIVAEQDAYVGNKGAYKAADRIGDARVESIDVGHFEFYTGESFERSVELEVEFLRQRL